MSHSRATLFLTAVLVVSSAFAARAQESGATLITGRVTDAKTGIGLADVTVQIVGQDVVGTRLAAVTGVDGRYRLINVRPGTVTITARRIGYSPTHITGLLIEPGNRFEQDIVLAPGSMELAAVVVSASVERATITEALDTQRMAPGVLSMITREQIQKSPDGDAAAVARRVSGITLTDDKTVNVRGLDPRYTQMSLNGALLPSPDPEKRVVPLDLFPSGLLDGITVSKTFTPDQPGNFSGAMVEIRTREFPVDRTASYAVGMGINAGLGGKALPTALGVGGESFAMAGAGRQLPAIVRAGGDLGSTTWLQRNAMINAFRDAWLTGRGGAEPNLSMSATFGGNEVVRGHRLGYIASGTYSLAREARLNTTRALGRLGNSSDEFEAYDVFTGSSASSSTLLGGILNLSTLVGKHTQVKLNNTYTRTADHEARIERGTLENESALAIIHVMDYVERSVWSSQMTAERETEDTKLKISLGGSAVKRSQPDRSEFAQQAVTGADGQERLLWMNTHGESAVRTFADLDEQAVEGAIDIQRRLGPAGSTHTLKIGALGRAVHRDTDTRAYSIFASSLSEEERALAPEVLFGGQFTQPGSEVMRLQPLSQGGSYSANDYLGAAYAMFDGFIAERWRLTSGARFEHSFLKLHAATPLGGRVPVRKGFGDLLPSAALTYTPNPLHNVRFSLTRTLARPEYRELAPILSRNVIAAMYTEGNANLVRTLIDNVDVRWEFYPERAELLSLGFFAKRFRNPIEAVAVATSNNAGLQRFVNAPGGTDLGIEIEGRRNLRALTAALEPLTAFANLTLMRSRIDLGDQRAAATNPARAMVGQAPYVVNAGLTYTSLADPERTATLLFNRIGKRISAAGEHPLPDIVEDARSSLDLSLRLPLVRGMSGRFDVKNVLDSPVTERQGTVIRERYWRGRVFQAGISWR